MQCNFAPCQGKINESKEAYVAFTTAEGELLYFHRSCHAAAGGKLYGPTEYANNPHSEFAGAMNVTQAELASFSPGFMTRLNEAHKNDYTVNYGRIYTFVQGENGIGVFRFGKHSDDPEFFFHADLLVYASKYSEPRQMPTVSIPEDSYGGEWPEVKRGWLNLVDEDEEYRAIFIGGAYEVIGYATVNHPITKNVQPAKLVLYKVGRLWAGIVVPINKRVPEIRTRSGTRREVLKYMGAVIVGQLTTEPVEEWPVVENPILPALALGLATGTASGLAFAAANNAMSKPSKRRKKYATNPTEAVPMAQESIPEIKQGENPVLDKSVEAFDRFHAFPAKEIEYVDMPKAKAIAKIGDWTGVGYFSPKWNVLDQEYRGKKGHRYGHACVNWPEDGAGIVAWIPAEDDPKGIHGTVIAWGKALLTEHGIEDDICHTKRPRKGKEAKSERKEWMGFLNAANSGKDKAE